MSHIAAANDKLREAEFFFILMEKFFDGYEFKYLVSAFLSALYSCTQHNRLQSSDPRFREWYRQVKESHLGNVDLVRLFSLRNKEIHHKGTAASQRVGMSFPDGIETTGLILETDFSSGRPVGRYKTAEMEEFQEHPVEQRWVWDAAEELDVMELCAKGLEVIRQLIRSRDEMGFHD